MRYPKNATEFDKRIIDGWAKGLTAAEILPELDPVDAMNKVKWRCSKFGKKVMPGRLLRADLRSGLEFPEAEGEGKMAGVWYEDEPTAVPVFNGRTVFE